MLQTQTKKIVLILVILAATILSYQKYSQQNSVVWGHYCGECGIDCSVFRKVTKSGLYVDRSDRFFKEMPHSSYDFDGVKEPKVEYEKYAWLLDAPVPEIMNSRRVDFGEPGEDDGCVYLLIFKRKYKTYEASINPYKVPESLKLLVEKLFGK